MLLGPLLYIDHCWPVAPQSYALILEQRRDALATFLGEVPEPLAESTTAFSPLFATCRCAAKTDPARVVESQREKSSSGAWQR